MVFQNRKPQHINFIIFPIGSASNTMNKATLLPYLQFPCPPVLRMCGKGSFASLFFQDIEALRQVTP